MALAPSMFRSSSYKLTAVSTSSEASAAASAKKQSDALGYPVKPYHGSTSNVASDPDVELVVVSVQAPGHQAAILPAIEAGKDVFVEWPGGVGLKGASTIAEAARKKGVKTMIGLQGRQAPFVKKVIPCFFCMRYKSYIYTRGKGQRDY